MSHIDIHRPNNEM